MGGNGRWIPTENTGWSVTLSLQQFHPQQNTEGWPWKMLRTQQISTRTTKNKLCDQRVTHTQLARPPTTVVASICCGIWNGGSGSPFGGSLKLSLKVAGTSGVLPQQIPTESHGTHHTEQSVSHDLPMFPPAAFLPERVLEVVAS